MKTICVRHSGKTRFDPQMDVGQYAYGSYIVQKLVCRTVVTSGLKFVQCPSMYIFHIKI